MAPGHPFGRAVIHWRNGKPHDGSPTATVVKRAHVRPKAQFQAADPRALPPNNRIITNHAAATTTQQKNKQKQNNQQPPERQQLHKGGAVLEDGKKLSELRVENDDVLALCLALEGGEGA